MKVSHYSTKITNGCLRLVCFTVCLCVFVYYCISNSEMFSSEQISISAFGYVFYKQKLVYDVQFNLDYNSKSYIDVALNPIILKSFTIEIDV